jgi:serine/threonine protein kinase
MDTVTHARVVHTARAAPRHAGAASAESGSGAWGSHGWLDELVVLVPDASNSGSPSLPDLEVFVEQRVGAQLAGPRHKVSSVDASANVGPWIRERKLGSGGNATVWLAIHRDSALKVALKVLDAKKQESERYRRFAQEVSVLRRLGAYEGVLPLVDACLPEAGSRERAWLAMPVATPISEALADASLETVVEALRDIAQTLARLQSEHGIGHRDIKPGNLYSLDGRWLVGDFGLVDVPGGDDLTKSGGQLGPANYTAYEVIKDPKTAASGPADVYSLAKTLWVLGTGQNWPPPGPQSANTLGLRLSDFRFHPKNAELDGLIERATATDHAERPTMVQVVRELSAWERLTSERVAVDLSGFQAELQRKLGKQLAERDIDDRRKDLARAAMQTLTERMRPLNDALRAAYPHTEVDIQHDRIAETLLSSKHLHWGVTPLAEWKRTTKITVGEDHSPFSLRIARAVVLLPDGTLRLRWMLLVGLDGMMGSTFSAQDSGEFAAPVGSVQQAEMIEQFVARLGDQLQAATTAFADALPNLA